MSVFEDRERAFESRYASDEEGEFKAMARRDKALGRWMGGLLGLTGDALEDYVLSVWRADLKQPGDADVFRKLMHDAAEHKLGLGEADVRGKMQELLAAAREELQGG